MSRVSDFGTLLAHQSREQIEAAAQRAFCQRLEVPVVFLLHLDDERARAIALQSGREAFVEQVRREAERQGLEPVIVWSLPGRVARALLMPWFSDFVEELVTLPDPTSYHLVVIVPGMIGLRQLHFRVRRAGVR